MCNLGVIDNNNFWIGGGADSREGMWGTLVRGRNGSLIRYRTDGVYFRDILHTSGEQFLASGSTQTGGKEAGAILFTPDGGRRWKLIYRTTNVKIINKLAASTSDTVWAVGDGGAIIRLDRTPN